MTTCKHCGHKKKYHTYYVDFCLACDREEAEHEFEPKEVLEK